MQIKVNLEETLSLNEYKHPKQVVKITYSQIIATCYHNLDLNLVFFSLFPFINNCIVHNSLENLIFKKVGHLILTTFVLKYFDQWQKYFVCKFNAFLPPSPLNVKHVCQDVVSVIYQKFPVTTSSRRKQRHSFIFDTYKEVGRRLIHAFRRNLPQSESIRQNSSRFGSLDDTFIISLIGEDHAIMMRKCRMNVKWINIEVSRPGLCCDSFCRQTNMLPTDKSVVVSLVPAAY